MCILYCVLATLLLLLLPIINKLISQKSDVVKLTQEHIQNILHSDTQFSIHE